MLPSDYLKLGWCQHAISLDANGNESDEDATEPVAWCIFGAVWECALGHDTQERLFKEIKNSLDGEHPSRWQDALPFTPESQAQVVELVRQAEINTGLRNAT